MKKLFVVGLCLVWTVIVCGQSTLDSISLQSVTVTSTRFVQFNTGAKVATTDSVLSAVYKTQTLADLLASQSQVFIKSYGQGIATASFRGSSAEQTAVLWKGFNLQSPMLGQVDFALITGDIADNISIQYGGNGALFGSGAVGGSIQLLSTPKYNSGLHANIGMQVGSFGHLREQAGVYYGNKKMYSSIKYFHLTSQNNFPYTNTFLPNKPTVTQTNANVFQQGIVNENYFKLRLRQELNITIWLQQTDKQVPPSMSVPQTTANQKDQTYRATAEWKMRLEKIILMARTAYFDESINYVNPLSTLLSGNSQSRTLITEAETRMHLSTKQWANIGINNTFISAFADGYGGTFNQNRTAVFVSYKTEQLLKKINTTISIRQEWVQQQFTPIMPSFGMEWLAKKWLKFFGNISRSYRLPTFNEMYWKSVTTHVKPEIGLGQELNSQTSFERNNISVVATLGAFNRNVKNWIVWQPAVIDWAPQNIKQVWSRGLEFDGKVSGTFAKCKLTYHFMVNYILSTNKQTTTPNDASVGQQLIYVPRITQQHQLLATFSTWHIALLQNYTGLRFTTTDNSNWLNEYSLTTFMAGKQFSIKRFALVCNVQLNNIFNAQYQAIADRPMPGRNFMLNTTFKF